MAFKKGDRVAITQPMLCGGVVHEKGTIGTVREVSEEKGCSVDFGAGPYWITVGYLKEAYR